MRILFDSKKIEYKDPFGTLIPGQSCRLRIHIPASVGTKKVECILQEENGAFCKTAPLSFLDEKGAYQRFEGTLTQDRPGLYFYWFRIYKENGSFRLFKYGDDTNMEAGDLWQVSCVPVDFSTPDWAKGALIYQVFPDRFCKAGDCDLSGKLLFRRQLQGHYGEAGLYRIPGHHHPVSEPHQQKLFQPPLRHR